MNHVILSLVWLFVHACLNVLYSECSLSEVLIIPEFRTGAHDYHYVQFESILLPLLSDNHYSYIMLSNTYVHVTCETPLRDVTIRQLQ